MLWGQESSHALKLFHGALYYLLACDFRSIIKLCKGIALLFQASCSGGLPTDQDQRCFSFPDNAANARSQSILPDFQSMSFVGGGMGLNDGAQGAALSLHFEWQGKFCFEPLPI